jgi:EAL domain-containing protein (putative c-di-GMP-specific phosphodiesterase class I)
MANRAGDLGHCSTVAALLGQNFLPSTADLITIVILASVREQGSKQVQSSDDVIDITDTAVSTLGAPVHAQVLAHLRDAVMLVDHEGVVSYASPNSGSILGRSADEWVGATLVDLVADADVGAVERALTRPAEAPKGPGSLLLGGLGPLMLFVDRPARLGPPGTRLLTFRPARSEDDLESTPGVLSDQVLVGQPFDPGDVSRLIEAIETDELTVHYQPEIDLESGLALGAEALVRWIHPDRGVVVAGDFVELAEASGLIQEIGRSVMRRACADFGNWARRFGGTVLTLRVNLSAEQLGDEGLVDVVGQALADADLESSGLCVEVTETALMSDPSALDVLDELRRTGVEVAVDDFGTGFSSLSQLKRLPVDVLKIDRSFVAGLGLSSEDTAITRAVVELARAVGLGVVAEGIEHPRQVDELLRLGCRRGQGWLYSRALPWAELETEFLRD